MTATQGAVLHVKCGGNVEFQIAHRPHASNDVGPRPAAIVDTAEDVMKKDVAETLFSFRSYVSH